MNVYPVSRSEFRVIRGVQNEIIFQVRDIDHKPVTVTNSDTVTIHILNETANTVLMRRDLSLIDTIKGAYQLVILPGEMDHWLTGPLRYCMTRNGKMMWTDQSYGAYGMLLVSDGPLPGLASAVSATWDDFSPGDGVWYSPTFVGAGQDSFTNGVHTFRVTMSDFTGTVRIDAIPIEQSDWYPVLSRDYTDFDGTATLDVQGNFLALRVAVTEDVMEVQYKG